MEQLIIVHWNKSTGPIILRSYPPEKSFPPKELFLKIWAQHELNKDKSIIEIEHPHENGDEHYISMIQEHEGENYFVVLVYGHSKAQDIISPDILAVIGKNLLDLINTNKINRAISEAFTTIKNYSKLEGEDLINFFHDKMKSTILHILREGVISKTNLMEILRSDYGFSTVNIDLLLISFIRENIIIKKHVPGSKDCYFLIKDLTCVRIPPKDLYEKDVEEKILKKYVKDVARYFSQYDCTQDIERKALVNFLIDNEVYSLILALRKGNLTVNECLNILKPKEELFDELLEKKLIFEAKGMVYLFSDIRFIKFTPYYLVKKLSSRYKKQEISLNQYLTHLNLLIETLRDHGAHLNYLVI